MKITPHPTGIGQLEINDAMAIIDDFHREALGLDFLYDNCSIAAINDLYHSKISKKRIVLIDSRAEVLREFLNWFAYTKAPIEQVGFVFPKTHSGITDWLVKQEELQHLSIRDYVINEHVIYLEFGSEKSADLDAHAVFAGVKFGLNISEANISDVSENSQETQELRKQLVSLLQSIDLIDTNPHSAAEIENSLAETEAPQQKEQKELIASLEGRIVTLQGKLDALQRKYDSLANSRLGKITLNHWNKKREQN